MQAQIEQLLQAAGQLVQTLGLLLQPALGILMVEPLLQQREAMAGGGLAPGDGLHQALLEVHQALGAGASVRCHQLGGGGGGGGTQVGGEVADGDVHLVAHSAHHRNGGACDGAGHRLLVEAPEIFKGAAAATDDEHIHLGAAVGKSDGRDYLGDGGAALHLGRVDEDRQIRGAALEHRQHVVQGGAGGRGDQPHGAGLTRQRALAALVEQPFGAEAALELLEAQGQHAVPGGLHGFDDELVVAAGLIEGDPRLHQYLHAILRSERHPAVVALEHGAAHLGRDVFQGEVPVARAWHRQVGELPRQPHQPQILLQYHAHGAVEAGDGEDLLLPALAGFVEVVQGWPCCCVRRSGEKTMGHILPQFSPSAESVSVAAAASGTSLAVPDAEPWGPADGS
ncbi:hypothetical protein D3C75_607160 [compost metagenome]